MSDEAILALENGRVFRGKGFGARGTTGGEVVFNTCLTGYQETLTDPSYRGQIVAMTNPQIGNTGVNEHDPESGRVWVEGFLVRELTPVTSSWRATGELDDYLRAQGVVAMSGLDTRALTRELRAHGALLGMVSSEGADASDLVRRVKDLPGLVGRDLVHEVTASARYEWSEGGAPWLEPAAVAGREVAKPFRVVALDYGIKRNILRRLVDHGIAPVVVPASTAAADVLAMKPDGVFLSNGPGDPAALTGIVAEIKQLVGRVPVFGICLGQQLLGLALGARTFKLKFGHHGGNHPVQHVASGKVEITTQNHGFTVDPDSLPAAVEVTHWNLNDHTCEGFRHKEVPLISVQYHPESAPGPHDSHYLFQEFVRLMREEEGEGVPRA